MSKLNYLMVILAITTLFACGGETAVAPTTSSTITFAGKITNPSSKVLTIRDRNNDTVAKIDVDESGAFAGDFEIEEKGYYTIFDGKEQTTAYLAPNFNLNMTLNTAEFDESIVYQGEGAEINNYLAQKNLQEEGFGNANYYGYYGKLSEQDFLKLTDSLHNVRLQLLEKTPNLDATFATIEKKALHLKKLGRIASFERTKQFVTKDPSYKVSETFPDAYADLDISDESLIGVAEYLPMVHSLFTKKAVEATKGEKDADITYTYIDLIGKGISSPKIKEELLFRTGENELSRSKNMEKLYTTVRAGLTNQKYIDALTDQYERVKKTMKGSVSPSFKFKDIDGKEVALESLRGKLVYIDIWATWCGPCKVEIPYLKKMEEKYHGKDIHFVSICTSDKEENWRKMVKDKELKGIQLFGDSKDEFFKDYVLQGIPRFILLDKEGKIVDANAKRPSNPDLDAEVAALLKS